MKCMFCGYDDDGLNPFSKCLQCGQPFFGQSESKQDGIGSKESNHPHLFYS